jgi:hypothetical protein
MKMTAITLSYRDFRSIRKQAKRELEAERAGFLCHKDMVAAHRAARVVKMRQERETRAAALLARRDRLRAANAGRSYSRSV